MKRLASLTSKINSVNFQKELLPEQHFAYIDPIHMNHSIQGVPDVRVEYCNMPISGVFIRALESWTLKTIEKYCHLFIADPKDSSIRL